MMVFDQQLGARGAEKWWTDLAGMDRPAFEKEVAGLVGPSGIFVLLRSIAEDRGGRS
jgi:hypothetical protein